MHFIDKEKHPLRRPVIEPSEPITPVLRFSLDISYLKAFRHRITKYLTATLSSEAAHVGYDMTASLNGRQNIGMNRP